MFDAELKLQLGVISPLISSVSLQLDLNPSHAISVTFKNRFAVRYLYKGILLFLSLRVIAKEDATAAKENGLVSDAAIFYS